MVEERNEVFGFGLGLSIARSDMVSEAVCIGLVSHVGVATT